MSDFKKRNIIIGALCGVLLLMMVGYAAFSTSLNINGTTSISSNWDIKITDVQEKNKVGSASSVDTYPKWENLKAEFQTNLVSPGDSITYDIKVENQGTINAKLKTVTTNDGNNQAIKFTRSGLTEGAVIDAGKSAILTIKVEYPSTITEQPENTTSTLTVTLDFEQSNKNENEIAIPPKYITMKGVQIELKSDGSSGLYVDPNPDESGRYVYAGAYPNNYITFNGEEWRIISFEADGTIKIMKNPTEEALTTNMVFDSTGKRTTEYCSDTKAVQGGCNVWAQTESYTSANRVYTGEVTTDSEMKEYLNGDYYDETITKNKDVIVSHEFYYGSADWQSTNLTTMVQQEQSHSAISNVGLIQGSDYIKSNTNTTHCGTHSLVNTNYSTCKSTTWMAKDLTSKGYWTLSPLGFSTREVLYVRFDGFLANTPAGYDRISVAPVVYLKSDIQLSGSGTQDNPYEITS